jgi:hypothetical protein
LREILKMAKRKAKRNVRESAARPGFRICREPVLRGSAKAAVSPAGGGVALPCLHGSPSLLAVARDARTIFAAWNADWRSLFDKTVPADRQVHLRLIGAGGVEQKTVPVEPMTATHYLTIDSPLDSCHLELGYFQPLDTWNCIAASNEVKPSPEGSAATAEVDLATIPFHLSFEELANLFGAPKDAPLAKAISTFEKRVISDSKPEELPPAEIQILKRLDLSLPVLVAGRRRFEENHGKTAAQRTRVLLQLTATSPSRGFGQPAGS